MPQNHIVKSFDEDLRALRNMVSQMGGMAEAQIAGAMEALHQRDIDLAMRVVDADGPLDQLEREAEQFAIETIARRAPMADDLREVVAALKISSAIERLGDYAKNIAKRSTVISKDPPIHSMVIITQMGRLVNGMLKDGLDAYATRDITQAAQVRVRDEEVDELYNSLFRALLTYMMENPTHITNCTHLLFVAKNLERIGDLTTNIAEVVHYIATGHHVTEERKKRDQTPFATIKPD